MDDEPRASLDGIPPRAGGPGTQNTARGQQEAAAVRGVRALELRMAGATFAQIATALGYSDAATARRAVDRALARDYARTADLRDEYRTLSLARCERLIRGHWPRAIAGDPQATDRVLRLMEREARLLGLDAPTQISVAPAQTERIGSLIEDLQRLHTDDVAARDLQIAELEAMLAISGDGDEPPPMGDL